MEMRVSTPKMPMVTKRPTRRGLRFVRLLLPCHVCWLMGAGGGSCPAIRPDHSALLTGTRHERLERCLGRTCHVLY